MPISVFRLAQMKTNYALIAAALGLFGGSPGVAETKAARPNIIVISTGDHGYADLRI